MSLKDDAIKLSNQYELNMGGSRLVKEYEDIKQSILKLAKCGNRDITLVNPNPTIIRCLRNEGFTYELLSFIGDEDRVIRLYW